MLRVGSDESGKSRAESWGASQPKNEGPSRMPTIISAITGGCRSLAKRGVARRHTATMTAICSSRSDRLDKKRRVYCTNEHPGLSLARGIYIKLDAKEPAIRRLIAVLWTSSMLVRAVAPAQAFPRNETDVTMGHWHLNTRDIEANKKIFVTMGGTAMKAGNFDVVRFPGVIVYLHQNLQNKVPPPTGGTVG